MCVARCIKLEAGLRLQLTAPKGRPSRAQANGLGKERFSGSSPEGATYGSRGYHAPSGLEAGNEIFS